VSGEQVLAAEIADDALLALAALAVRLDQPHILMLDTLAARRLDRAQEHAASLSSQRSGLIPRQSREIS
jgi:hypothetical protein